jgi:hypothetical protein
MQINTLKNPLLMELSLRQLAYANDHCQTQDLIGDVFLPVAIHVFTPEGRPGAVV